MPHNGREKSRRERLFHRQGGRCFWCNCQMIMRNRIGGGRLRANEVTIDHLRDRLDTTRQDPCYGEQRLVAACYRCNNGRSKVSTAETPIEVKWQTGGSLPSAVSLLAREAALMLDNERIVSDRLFYFQGWTMEAA
jgi:hypothetical protein